MASLFDRDRLIHAFELLGADLAARNLFLEIAVYGGGALILQFSWRRTTEDLDAVVREGFDEAALTPSVLRVAEQLGLESDWLNNAVGAYTPLDEDDALFDAAGSYPTGGPPGLRTFIARPHYLLAMKLQALASLDRGNRDLDDARALAAHLGITDTDELHRLYWSIYDEAPPVGARGRFGAVIAREGA